MSDLGEFDCIVAGGGPTGAVLTALLGQAGRRVLLLERDAQVYPLPRAVHMDHEVMRVLQQVGAAGQIAPHASSVDAYIFQNAQGDILLESRGGSTPSSSGYVASTMFVQPALEAILRRQLVLLPTIDAHFGAAVVDMDQPAQAKRVGVTFEQDGSRHTASARFLVGCDGAASFVRRWLQAAVEDLGFDEPWVVVDTLVKGNVGLPESTAYQYCDPRRPTTCVPAGPGRRRWEFMLLPGETREQMQTPDAIWPLLEPWGGRRTLDLVRAAVYRFHALLAKEWRHGRVLLAGDAAHQTPPFMGQGLCAGLRDAANLAWKLDRVLGGQSADALLDTYQVEREPHFRHVVETSVAMGRIVCELDPEKAAQRDANLIAARTAGERGPASSRGGQVAPLTAGIIHSGSPDAGWLFPQPNGTCGRASGRMDELMGYGFRLIVDDAALLPAQALLQRADVNPVVLGGSDDRGFVESDGPSATEWLRSRNVHAALLRPDHCVFGTATDAKGIADLLTALGEQLA